MKFRRCLVSADGFYEWRKVNGSKQPYYIHMRDDRPFAFAGLWDDWERAEGAIQSCTLITTEANDLMAPIHDRMPVVIPKSEYDLWLDSDVKDPKRLQPLLVPYPSEEMEAYLVSTLVNNPANEDERCIRRVG